MRQCKLLQNGTIGRAPQCSSSCYERQPANESFTEKGSGDKGVRKVEGCIPECVRSNRCLFEKVKVLRIERKLPRCTQAGPATTRFLDYCALTPITESAVSRSSRLDLTRPVHSKPARPCEFPTTREGETGKLCRINGSNPASSTVSLYTPELAHPG